MGIQIKLPASLLKFQWANVATPAMQWAAEQLSGLLDLWGRPEGERRIFIML